MRESQPIVRQSWWCGGPLPGSIRGPDDEPINASGLFVSAVHVDGSGSEGVTVARDGRFTIRPPDSTYRLQVTRYCPPDPVELVLVRGSERLHDGRERGDADRGGRKRREAGIVIRLPGSLRELAPECFAGDG